MITIHYGGALAAEASIIGMRDHLEGSSDRLLPPLLPTAIGAVSGAVMSAGTSGFGLRQYRCTIAYTHTVITVQITRKYIHRYLQSTPYDNHASVKHVRMKQLARKLVHWLTLDVSSIAVICNMSVGYLRCCAMYAFQVRAFVAQEHKRYTA